MFCQKACINDFPSVDAVDTELGFLPYFIFIQGDVVDIVQYQK